MVVISASRRTDLPAFYPEETIRKIEKIHLEQYPVDAVVFWTKNAEPIIPYLDILTEARIPFYFQYTVNAYGPEFEPNVPSLAQRIETFKALSTLIGPDRVIWRYDPIIISSVHSPQWHKEKIIELAEQFDGYTKKLVFSYFDKYQKLAEFCTYNRAPNGYERPVLENAIASITGNHGMVAATCAEVTNTPGVITNSCIDINLLERIGVPKNALCHAAKDPSQRWNCHCYPSVDIGHYRTCKHGCQYCYAR